MEEIKCITEETAKELADKFEQVAADAENWNKVLNDNFENLVQQSVFNLLQKPLEKSSFYLERFFTSSLLTRWFWKILAKKWEKKLTIAIENANRIIEEWKKFKGETI